MPIPDERIDGKTAASIHGTKEGAFNNQRRVLQMVYNRGTGKTEFYPSQEVIDALWRAAGSPGKKDGRIRPADSWFQSTHCLVVPEWGGLKLPHGSWTYSRRRLEDLRDRGPDALIGAPVRPLE